LRWSIGHARLPRRRLARRGQMIALKVRAPCRLADASDGPRRGSSCPRRRFGTNVCPVATVRTEATRFSPLIGRRLALSRPWCDPRRSWQTGRCDRRHGRQHRRHAGTARRLHGEPSTPHRPGPISTPTRARHPSRAGAARHRHPHCRRTRSPPLVARQDHRPAPGRPGVKSAPPVTSHRIRPGSAKVATNPEAGDLVASGGDAAPAPSDLEGDVVKPAEPRRGRASRMRAGRTTKAAPGRAAIATSSSRQS
jgi:hypothetical protein